MCLQKCNVFNHSQSSFGEADVVITSGGVSRGNKETFFFFRGHGCHGSEKIWEDGIRDS